MKEFLLPAIKLTALSLLLLAGAYSIVLAIAAQAVHGEGQGRLIHKNGKIYYANIAQKFSEDRYFSSRPSSVDYNASGSGGSNKGPDNQEYLKTVQARIDTFLNHNPGIDKSQIPVDLVTASGSGLDPDISVQAAMVQIKRISKIRNIPENKLHEIIVKNTEKPLVGMFGPEKINVLKLNLALDDLR